MIKSLFHEKQLIGPQKYTLAGSKSSQNASIFHEKNDGGVKKYFFSIFYPLKINFLKDFIAKKVLFQKRHQPRILGQSFLSSIYILVKESIDRTLESFFVVFPL